MNATSKRSEAQPSSANAARAMTPWSGGPSTAEMLKDLRRSFPDMPLAERVAAIEMLTRSDHIPR